MALIANCNKADRCIREPQRIPVEILKRCTAVYIHVGGVLPGGFAVLPDLIGHLCLEYLQGVSAAYAVRGAVLPQRCHILAFSGHEAGEEDLAVACEDCGREVLRGDYIGP